MYLTPTQRITRNATRRDLLLAQSRAFLARGDLKRFRTMLRLAKTTLR